MADIEKLRKVLDNDFDGNAQQEAAALLLGVLQHGLQGNRAVPGTVWGVVSAAVRAYPVQLSPSVERAQLVCDVSPGQDLLTTWVLQAAADGNLVTFLSNLRVQPHILTAYSKAAPLRDQAQAAELAEVAGMLQSWVKSSPYLQFVEQQGRKTPPLRSPRSGDAAPVQIETEEDALRRRAGGSGGGHSSRRVSTSSDKAPECAAEGQQRPEGGGRASQDPAAAGSDAAPAKSGGLGLAQGLSRRIKAGGLWPGGAGIPDPEVQRGSSDREQQKHRGRSQNQLVRVRLVVAPGATGGTAAGARVQLRIKVLEPHGRWPAGLVASAGEASTVAANAASAAAAKVASSFAVPSNLARAALAAAKGGLGSAGKDGAGGATVVTSDARGAAGDTTSPVPDGGGAPLSPVAPSSQAGGVIGMLQGMKQTAMAGGHELTESVGAALASQVAAVRGGLGLRKRWHGGEQEASGEAEPPAKPPAAPAGSGGGKAAAADSGGAKHPARAMSGGAGSWLPSASGVLSRVRSAQSRRDGKGDGGISREGKDKGSGEGAGEGEEAEDDMWSGLRRLGKASVDSAGGSGSGAAASPKSAAAADGRATERQRQLEASAAALAERASEAARGIAAAAGRDRGSHGDECPQLVALVGAVRDVMGHGLLQAPAQGGWGLAGWLPARTVTPFMVLQALEAGSKQHGRVLVGAEGIARMQAARSAGDAAKLDLWIRASLNEQLLGSRVSMLGAQAAALKAWYEPGSLLLGRQGGEAAAEAPGHQDTGHLRQQEQQCGKEGANVSPLAVLLDALRQVDAHRFSLRVDPASDAASPAAHLQAPLPSGPSGSKGSWAPGGLLPALGGVGGLATFQWPAGADGKQRQQQQQPGRRRVAPISEGRAGSADDDIGGSDDALSPLSTSDETAAPDWWSSGQSPWQGAPRSGDGDGGAGGSDGSGGAAGGGKAAGGPGAAGQPSASAQLQHELEASLAAPVPALLQGRASWSGGPLLTTARSTGSLRDKAGSPEWSEALAAAARRTGDPGRGGGGGTSGGGLRVGDHVARHRHKRSNSFNDLAELQVQVALQQQQSQQQQQQQQQQS